MRDILNEENSLKESERIVKQTEGRSTRDETVSKINNTLSELKVFLEVVTYLGIKAEDERGREEITSAVENVKAGDFEGTLNSLEKSCEFLREKIDETVEKELEKMKSHEVVSEDGSGTQDIKRAISKLEKAKENKEYEDLPDRFFQAWNKVKKR